MAVHREAIARRRSRRANGDDGSVMVEAAMVLPILFLFVFGIIDFGFAFNDWISVRQGGRDGLRQAIVNPSPSAPACTTVGIDHPGPQQTAIACYTKDKVGLGDSGHGSVRVKLYFEGAYTAGNPVKICVQYPTSSLSGVFSSVLDGKVLDTQVETLIETVPDGTTLVPFQETAVSSWPASCSSL